MRMLMARQRAALVVVVIATLTVGCASDPAPTAPSTTNPVTAPPPSSDPTSPPPAEPQQPEPMATPDSSGAEAFARYAVDVLNHASMTGDVSEWTALASPNCATCASFTSDIEAAGPTPDGAVEVEATKPAEIDPGTFYTVATIVDQSPFTRPDGSSSEGGRFALLWALRFVEEWTIEAIDVGPPDAPWAQ